MSISRLIWLRQSRIIFLFICPCMTPYRILTTVYNITTHRSIRIFKIYIYQNFISFIDIITISEITHKPIFFYTVTSSGTYISFRTSLRVSSLITFFISIYMIISTVRSFFIITNPILIFINTTFWDQTYSCSHIICPIWSWVTFFS